MKKIFLTLLLTLFSFSLLADEKPGRFFKDQPDVNDDYQIHFIYFLAKNTKDKERDINGWIEKQVKKTDDLFFELTGNKQRFKLDRRKDGKLDISFARMDRKARRGGWNVNYPDYYLQKIGFNNPKKLYLSFTDASSGDGGQMGPHHGYIFIGKASGQIDKISVHELLHGLGFAMPCSKGQQRGAHLGSGILGPDLQKKLGKAIYNHGDPTCPDLKDSVYLTPTSDNPTSGMISKLEDFDYTMEQSEKGYENFTVIKCNIKSIEWLYLAAKGHRRAIFNLDNKKIVG